ncbi:unnamed protein product [Rhizophagus irregularis]|nr:unnamed protein product [Rhizophagus irregularis]
MKRYNISIFSSFARCISFSGCTFYKLLSLWMRWNSVLDRSGCNYDRSGHVNFGFWILNFNFGYEILAIFQIFGCCIGFWNFSYNSEWLNRVLALKF